VPTRTVAGSGSPKASRSQVKVHDLIDPTLGEASPYGVYDVGTNTGLGGGGHRPRHRCVRGRHHPCMVAQCRKEPAPQRVPTVDQRRWRGLQRLLHRQWKTELVDLDADTGLAITVCHLPPDLASGTRSNTACSPTSR
jgi:hypothetical protein